MSMYAPINSHNCQGKFRDIPFQLGEASCGINSSSSVCFLTHEDQIKLTSIFALKQKTLDFECNDAATSRARLRFCSIKVWVLLAQTSWDTIGGTYG